MDKCRADRWMQLVEVEVECHPEHEGPEDWFASGDADQDRADCQWIREELAGGNGWAWCIARVVVTCPEILDEEGAISSNASLGGVSCRDRAEFMRVFYPDMLGEALEALDSWVILEGVEAGG